MAGLGLSPYIKVYRPFFITASIVPVLVGSAGGYAGGGDFKAGVFVMATLAMVFLHLGANAVNEYFDYLSGNDEINTSSSVFSGGSKCIQKGLIAPSQVFLQGMTALAVGAGLGLVIVLTTKSLFILTLGLIGLLGGYFYTAPPLKIGYRGFGEILIAFLFGFFPVCGSYYLQAGWLDVFILLSAAIVGALIFLIILINEFPDHNADAAVNKNTLVVVNGFPKSVRIYKIVLVISYLSAAGLLLIDIAFWAGLLYLMTLPLGIYAFKSAEVERLHRQDDFIPNKVTILLHGLGSVALAAGFLITGLTA
jgi:1,4-dihydroxy-2-naphthoate octaprenyltransferase